MIINFFIIAIVLFTIVRIINNLRELNDDIKEGASKAILNKNEIAERYGERIASRLFGEYNAVIFRGSDIRQQKIIKK